MLERRDAAAASLRTVRHRRALAALPHDGETIVTATWPDPLEVPSFDREAAGLHGVVRAVERHSQLARRDRPASARAVVTLVRSAENVPGANLVAAASHRFSTGDRAGARFGENRRQALGVRSSRGRAAARSPLERYRKESGSALRSEIERGEKKLGNEAVRRQGPRPTSLRKEREKLRRLLVASSRAIAGRALRRSKGAGMTGSVEAAAVIAAPRAALRSSRIVARLAHQILEPDDAQDGLVLLGIRRGGEALAAGWRAKSSSIQRARARAGLSQHQSLSRRPRHPRASRFARSLWTCRAARW